MARKSKKNPNYRTKEIMAKDLAVVLNADLSRGTKYAVCRQIASEWTELNGKYKGCRFWSSKAFELWEANPKAKCFRHEHAVPKKVVVELLLSFDKPDAGFIYRVCEAFLIGVVVTLEEEKALNARFNSTMPSEFGETNNPSNLDPLLRYKQCGIEVIGVTWPGSSPEPLKGVRPPPPDQATPAQPSSPSSPAPPREPSGASVQTGRALAPASSPSASADPASPAAG